MKADSVARISLSLRTASRASLTLLCAGTLLSCAGDPPIGSADTAEAEAALAVGDDTDLVRTLKAIEVSPGDSVVVADLGKTATRTFKVLARYNDRSTAEVSTRATFSIDNASIGSLSGASFTSATRSTAQVDFAKVTVRYREGAIEVSATANLTVVWMRTSGPTPDALLTLPYLGAPASTTAGFGTNLQSIDAFLAVDTTGSMTGEITAINSSLTTTIVPGVRAAVSDSNFGVGALEDFGAAGYGQPACHGSAAPDDSPFILLAPMTSDLPTVTSAFGLLLAGSSPRGCGGDTPEGQMEGLYQIATGAGNVVSGVVNIPPHTGGRGGVEFRPGALPIVSVITDAVFHTVGEPAGKCTSLATDYTGTVAAAAHSRTVTTTALKNLCARVVGVSVDTGSEAGCMAHADMIQLATDTGAVVQPEAWGPTGTRPATCASTQCCTGTGGAGEAPNAAGMCPLVHKGVPSGAGIGAQVAAGITQLTKYAPFNVGLVSSGSTTSVDGTVTLPGGKKSSDFLTTVAAVDGTPPTTPAGMKSPTAAGDHFTGVVPGSTVRFTVTGKNDFLPATAKPQIFKATLTSQAAGCATLEQHDVLIIVPAA